MKKIIIAVMASATLLSSASGDMFAPSHSCSKPYKPFQFTSEWEYDNYVSGVRRYRQCIEQFVQEQNRAASRHLQAADDAIEEWNRFVQYELN